ncbi:rps7 (apicoplast) [Plasmodium falciparum IGH-CR14]|uniref:Apicoplast ribosomal protein S7 n=5 Tax=Plasmodium (Laverania) TaxID=418107 RepID=Q25819_PLAF7|nr:apicoplast ribosomal protein S7, putative [Plasmodium reichenowi]KAF4331506.1 apicoplast ribosomal protein S7 [Plasmodium falciparum NF54]KNZ35478.1 rps7 [Plasmodium falciparum IGH-CR14]KNZ35551.1 rps7 [Plasmodium falciparum RAJ116]CAA64592.1 rps7 [Plasmodium falciparum]VWP78951.1 apicoplast ribosomal protein S7 [Plasmodium falciparum 3D7]|eukprot:YP_009455723.1 apicoplast ribosomal protein S7 (apicoplast) [Plasmodium falciparum 3D7]
MIIFKYFIKIFLKKGKLNKSIKLLIYILYLLKKITNKSSIFIFNKAIKNLLLPFSFLKIKINHIKYNIPIIISYEQSIFNIYKLLNNIIKNKNILLYKIICKYIIFSYNKEGELYKIKLNLIKQFISNRVYIYLLKKNKIKK